MRPETPKDEVNEEEDEGEDGLRGHRGSTGGLSTRSGAGGHKGVKVHSEGDLDLHRLIGPRLIKRQSGGNGHHNGCPPPAGGTLPGSYPAKSKLSRGGPRVMYQGRQLTGMPLINFNSQLPPPVPPTAPAQQVQRTKHVAGVTEPPLEIQPPKPTLPPPPTQLPPGPNPYMMVPQHLMMLQQQHLSLLYAAQHHHHQQQSMKQLFQQPPPDLQKGHQEAPSTEATYPRVLKPRRKKKPVQSQFSSPELSTPGDHTLTLGGHQEISLAEELHLLPINLLADEAHTRRFSISSLSSDEGQLGRGQGHSTSPTLSDLSLSGLRSRSGSDSGNGTASDSGSCSPDMSLSTLGRGHLVPGTHLSRPGVTVSSEECNLQTRRDISPIRPPSRTRHLTPNTLSYVSKPLVRHTESLRPPGSGHGPLRKTSSWACGGSNFSLFSQTSEFDMLSSVRSDFLGQQQLTLAPPGGEIEKLEDALKTLDLG